MRLGAMRLGSMRLGIRRVDSRTLTRKPDPLAPTGDPLAERAAHPLLWPRSQEAAAGRALGGNADYRDLRMLTWRAARDVMQIEHDVCERILAGIGREDDAMLQDIMNTYRRLLMYLDIGVAAAVTALSAARCIPVDSCNGAAFGGGHSHGRPFVRAYLRPEIQPLLAECAVRCGVVLEVDEGGAARFHTGEIAAFPAFAREIHARAAAIRALRLPDSRIGPRPNQGRA